MSLFSPGHLPRRFDARAIAITEGMKLAAAEALADLVGADLSAGFGDPVSLILGCSMLLLP
ncbi:MAG: hypothetical protein R2709_11760 [Marmoricola sp.]